MKKYILSIVVFVLLCCGLLLTLSACGPDRDKKDMTTPDNPPGIEVDAEGEGNYESNDSTDIVVTPKDPDMDIVITPKDPDIDVTVLPDVDLPADEMP